MKNWDDLRYLVAVHKTGSMSSAARLLDTNPATVSRRLARLSEALGFDLFLKTPNGWVANEAISDLIESITGFEHEIESYLNRRETEAGDLKGSITIGCPPSLAGYVLFPGLVDFRNRAGDVDLVFHDQTYQDALGDHDLFVTPVRPEQGRLIVRFIGKITTNLYCYEDSPRGTDYIGLTKMHDKFAPTQHGRELMGGRDPVVRVDTFREVANCVRATRLPGIMPALAAQEDSSLVPFDPEAKAISTPIYLCFHETRKKDPVLQMVADWIAEQFSKVDTN